MSDFAPMTPLGEFVYTTKYARWIPEESRRETWVETVDRYVDFFRHHLTGFGLAPSDPAFSEVRQAILDREILPSMRALASAGKGLSGENLMGFNCSGLSVNVPRAFPEALYLSMCGVGVGYSVREGDVTQLPAVPPLLIDDPKPIIVPDSREGWAEAFEALINGLYAGRVHDGDVSQVRPAGAYLKSSGGRASGPQPLVDLFEFTVDLFRGASGRQLTSLECHDLMTMTASIAQAGGKRRSAMISLFSEGDEEMLTAKSGAWWEEAPYRAFANNSVALDDKPSKKQFTAMWDALVASGSGEPGFLNFGGMRRRAAEHGGRDASRIALVNPCAEAKLRDGGLCNLTEVRIDAAASVEDVERRIRLASILGTWQSTLTKFGYVRSLWAQNAEEERLLGVSLTGHYSNPLFSDIHDKELPSRLNALRSAARDANAEESERLGINASVAITLGKPAGSTSALMDVASGIHPYFSPFYLRRIRVSKVDPVCNLLMDSGVPAEEDAMNAQAVVFTLPVRAPEGAVVQSDLSALEHIELVAIYTEHWCEHTQSCTVTVADDEWASVGEWVFKNWDRLGGVSFLPAGDGTVYPQMPYEACDEVTYRRLVEEFPSVRWADLAFYETTDGTSSGQTLACAAGGCDDVDLVQEGSTTRP